MYVSVSASFGMCVSLFLKSSFKSAFAMSVAMILRSIMANILKCDILLCRFELQLPNQTNTLEKCMNCLYLRSMGYK